MGRPLLPSLLLTALAASPLWGQPAAETRILPPELPWDGASRSLIADADDPWITPAETTGLRTTPSYDETVTWLRRLVDAAPELEMVPFGTSGEGRNLWLVIASADRAFTPQALRRTGKPLVLAQGGIHGGEIDGKDAGLMLLRDMTVGGTRRDLLDGAVFLFVPIFNVDGHERSSRFGRVNQRGPEVMGWRTTARNLNLNRDYTKIDTPEMRAMIRLLDTWQPDLYLDLHVTDGADYQYDITWGSTGPDDYSPAVHEWTREVLRPAIHHRLEAMGHIPGPMIFGVDWDDLSQGIFRWKSTPRLSDGYGQSRHLPSILVENHSLKPYDQRVLGTYVLLESVLRTVAREAAGLRRAIARDRDFRPGSLPLDWTTSDQPLRTELLGVESRVEPSAVSGTGKVIYTGRPVTFEVPVISRSVPAVRVAVPAAYWVPASWPEIIDRLAVHGIEMERLAAPRTLEIEMWRLENVVYDEKPFEGRFRVRADPVAETRTETFPAGSVRVSTDQPLGLLAVLLLEPASTDSFFQWGFFHSVLQSTEYIEGYVLEPMAEGMLAEDPELRAAFEKKLHDDPEFAADPEERLRWFYERTPFYDERSHLYPIGRETSGAARKGE